MSATAVERSGLGTLLMVVRLSRGLVRRNRSFLVVWLWMVPMITRTVAEKGGNVRWVMAGSMALAVILAGQAGDGAGCREHRVLPVTNREIWITRWLNAALVVPVFLLVLKSVGAVLAPTGGKAFIAPETLLLSALFDVVYAGALMPVPLWLEFTAGSLARRLGTTAFRVALLLLPLFFLLSIAGPFIIARDLPAHFSEFTTTSALILSIGVAMMVAGLLWNPQHGEAPLMFRRAPAPPVQAPPASPEPADRFTGVFGVIWSHLKATFVLAAVGIGATIAASPLVPRPDPNAPRFLAAMFLIFTFMAISMASVWASRARGLRVLPISVTQINALFVFTPVLTWVEVWMMLLIVHAAIGLPINIELSPLAIGMYAGFSALTHALGFRFSGSVAGQTVTLMIGIVAAVGSAVLLFEKQDQWTRLLVLLTALACLAIAALINHYTLTRSTSSALAYRRPGLSVRP